MTITRSTLVDDFRRIGLQPNGIVMIHASVRAVGPVIGGPDEIHRAVEDAVLPGGTVMMFVGRGHLTPETGAEILAHQPAFDYRHARASREFGVLAEMFRSSPGTVCSQHVARMSARGTLAGWLMADHPWLYGFGKGSPLDKLCVAGGKVLLLGSYHDEVTLLHYAEHIAPFEGKRIARYKVPLMRGGQHVWVDCEEFDTSSAGVHKNWPNAPFRVIVDDFIMTHGNTDRCRVARCGNAESVLIDAQALVDHAVPIMVGWAAGMGTSQRLRVSPERT